MGENNWGEEFAKFLDVTLQESAHFLMAVVEELEEVAIEVDQNLADAIAPLLDHVLAYESLLDQATQPLGQTINPLLDHHPACVGCRHYHGQTYGDAFLVCAMYPYGWSERSCPDWESVWR